MRRFIEELKDFPKKGDWVLLILCLVTSGFGEIVIASATNAPKFGSNVKYILIQLLAIMLGIMMYAIVSSIDVDFISEHRGVLVAFNIFLLLLLIPFGTDNNTGNRSWLDFPLLPINVQPAEICKISYILIMASVMASHQNDVSSFWSVMHMVLHLGILVGLNMALSRDAGVSLIFVFIFIGMTFAGGVNILWFVAAISGIGAAHYLAAAGHVPAGTNSGPDRSGIRQTGYRRPVPQYHQPTFSHRRRPDGAGPLQWHPYPGRQPVRPAHGLCLFFHWRGTGLCRLLCRDAAGVCHHCTLHPDRHPLPGLYAPSDLLRRCLGPDVPGTDQCGYVHWRYARYRPDAASHQLRRLLRRYHFRYAGAGFRCPRATAIHVPRTIYPAIQRLQMNQSPKLLAGASGNYCFCISA